MSQLSVVMSSLLLGAARASPSHYPSETDVGDVNARQGRVFYYGNGTAQVNSTTVLITTSFATIVGLGVLSVFHDAALKAQAARNANSDAMATTTTTTTTAPVTSEDQDSGSSRISSRLHALALYRKEMAEYEKQYAEYRREYAAWAEAHGLDPTPPEEIESEEAEAKMRRKRYFFLQLRSRGSLERSHLEKRGSPLFALPPPKPLFSIHGTFTRVAQSLLPSEVCLRVPAAERKATAAARNSSRRSLARSLPQAVRVL